jgi:hypothetical protein
MFADSRPPGPLVTRTRSPVISVTSVTEAPLSGVASARAAEWVPTIGPAAAGALIMDPNAAETAAAMTQIRRMCLTAGSSRGRYGTTGNPFEWHFYRPTCKRPRGG